jgi:rRNA-processing protein FCF1
MLGNLEKEQVMLSDFELAEIVGLEQLQGIDAGDREFVRAAASVHGAIFVTTDGPLIERLREQGIDQKYGFTVLSPQEALSMAGPVASP